MKKESRHLIMVKVDNRPGVLSRITGLFTRRGYNIESLVTGMTETDSVYHITMTLIGTDDDVALLASQLERCMEVISVICDSTGDRQFISREMILMRIPCSEPKKRVEIITLSEAVGGCNVAGVGEKSVIVEISGDETAVSTATRAFESFGDIELIHSGTVGIDIY